jgi:selenide,water dikinase
MMTSLNDIGEKLGELRSVSALTDVTGFGLLGHLIEMADGSNLSAMINYPDVPIEAGTEKYIAQICFPDNLFRNWNAYEKKVEAREGSWFIPLCDPQTNGGLLAAVRPNVVDYFLKILNQSGIHSVLKPIGRFTEKRNNSVKIMLS